jgi:Fur family ferric uptake transcriptional regulator
MILENTVGAGYQIMGTGIIIDVHDHHDSDWSARALESLQAQGLRNGGARRAVVEHLGREVCCTSAQEIFGGIRSHGGRVGIASVYRALDQLVELDLVQRVELGDGITRFEPSHADGDHHHHLVCDDCGKVEPFSDPDLERALEQTASRLAYEMQAHEVVLHGHCGDCVPAAAGR